MLHAASKFGGLAVLVVACGARTGLDIGVTSDAAAVSDASDAGGNDGGPAPLLAVSGSAAFYRSKSGQLFAWGDGPNGEISDAGPDAYPLVIFPTPKLVMTSGYPTQPSPMADGSCLIIADGTVYCWGLDDIIDSHDTSKLTLAPTPPGAPIVSGAVQIWASQNSQRQCARLGDGSMKCWGYWPVCDPALRYRQELWMT